MLGHGYLLSAIPRPESCAVVLTALSLKQKSRIGDTTPRRLQYHGLPPRHRTGNNETISYISLKTGLVVRVTEDAQQFMDVSSRKPMASNQIHYNMNAAGHTEVFLLPMRRRPL